MKIKYKIRIDACCKVESLLESFEEMKQISTHTRSDSFKLMSYDDVHL